MQRDPIDTVPKRWDPDTLANGNRRLKLGDSAYKNEWKKDTGFNNNRFRTDSGKWRQPMQSDPMKGEWRKDTMDNHGNSPMRNDRNNNRTLDSGRTNKNYEKKYNREKQPMQDSTFNTSDPALRKSDPKAANTKSTVKNEDKVSMTGGKLYITRNGKSEQVTEDITLDDGTVVMANGTIRQPNGSSAKLKNGQKYSLTSLPKKAVKGKN